MQAHIMPMRMFVEELAIRDARPRPTQQEDAQHLPLAQERHDPNEQARANVATGPGLENDEFVRGGCGEAEESSH